MFFNKFSKFLVLTILFCELKKISGKAEGPNRDLFIGDFEQFSCNASSEKVKWVYRYKTWFKDVSDSDIIQDKYTIDRDLVSRQSFIRIKPELQGMLCFDGEKEIADVSLNINKFKNVDYFSEPTCEDKPKIILKRWNRNAWNTFWVSHYVTDEYMIIPDGVSGLKVSCLSKSKVKWSISEKDKLTEFRYGTSQKEGCYYATMILLSMNPTSAQKFTCSNSLQESTVTFQLSPTRYSDDDGLILDFNKTQECIEYLGTTVFGNQTLAWTTTGTSLLSIGMMMGIVFLKKQLEKQKQNNPSNQPNNQ